MFCEHNYCSFEFNKCGFIVKDKKNRNDHYFNGQLIKKKM